MTAPIMVRTISRMSRPEKSSRRGRMLPLHPLWLSGILGRHALDEPFTSARAREKLHPRLQAGQHGKAAAGALLLVNDRYHWNPGEGVLGNWKRGGMTPTTVWAAALTMMDFADDGGSRLNRRLQIASLSSTTWGAPG